MTEITNQSPEKSVTAAVQTANPPAAKIAPSPVLSPTVVPPPNPPVQVGTTVAARINAVVGSTVQPPKGVKRGTTEDIDTGYLHLLLYGETDSRKTTTAAKFSGPKNTIFVLTRGIEQLRPVQKENFPYVQVPDSDGLLWALQNPESAAKYIYDGPTTNAETKANLLAWEKSP